MGNQYFRLVMASDDRNPIERLLCLKELFESLADKEIVSDEDISEIINHAITVLEKYKEQISELP